MAVAVSLLAPVLAPAPWLIALLIVGMPAYGTIFAPAAALLSAGADRRRLNQGLAFGLANLAWATGQAVASAGSGAVAQATSDLVPYSLLAGTCLATLVVFRRKSQLLSGLAGAFLMAGRHVQGGIAVEEPERLEPERDGVDRHDRPVLRAGDVVDAEHVPEHHVGVLD